MEIRTIIIDDEDLAADLIERLLLSHESIRVIGKYYSSLEALKAIEEEQPDLIFSDIQMPNLSGIDLVEKLQYKPLVIFTTAFSEFAVDAYNLNVLDYVVKPIAKERFDKAVVKAILQFQILQYYDLIAKEDKWLVLKKNGVEHKVKYAEITHIEGLKQYAIIHVEREKFYLNNTLKNIENEWANFDFVRIHKSFIVNKSKMTKLTANSAYIDNLKIPIGRSYKDSLK